MKNFVRRNTLISQRDAIETEIKELEKDLPAEILAFDNPFRVPFYQKNIRVSNILTHEEFGLIYTNESGISFVKIDEINDMIEKGIIKVDYDKLEKYIFENRVTTNSKKEE